VGHLKPPNHYPRAKGDSSDDKGSSLNDEDDEEMALFVKSFGKFIK
jgi:hypothetical protein